MATPEAFRPGWRAIPRSAGWRAAAARLAEGVAQEAALAARAAHTEGRLRRLLRINKRLNSELRLPRLLEMIVDTVIELTDAERGFLLLEDESGQLVVKVARNIDQRTLDGAELELSRSIARQAAAGGEPIVTIDAAGDDALQARRCRCRDLHLRSILAVPLHVKGRPVGTIYVDHRLRKGAFGADAVSLVLDFAEQAAIAVENARLLGELRRRERQVDALNRRMQVELSARREELTGIKKELRENREALAVRYDYRNIVGRTPRMLELFRLLDRVTDTDAAGGDPGRERHRQGAGRARDPLQRPAPRAPLRLGELRRDPGDAARVDAVRLRARRLHRRRARHARPVRGRRRRHAVPGRGRRDVGRACRASCCACCRPASSAASAASGRARSTSASSPRPTAISRAWSRRGSSARTSTSASTSRASSCRRCATGATTSRSSSRTWLAKHARRGRHASAAAGAAKPIDPEVMARLIDYRWPGNVRELENEIMRAMALSGERITVADLSPQVAARGDGAARGCPRIPTACRAARASSGWSAR